MSIWSRLGNVFRSDRVDRDLDEELEFHVEARTRDLMADGLSREEASREARRRLGRPLQLREQSRDVKVSPWLDSIVRDVRLGLRMLRTHALVQGAAVASLALALGACVAACSLVEALLLRPLPVRAPDRLITLAFPTYAPERPESDTFNDPLFVRLRDSARDQVDQFAMSTQVMRPAVFETGGDKEFVRTQFVSGDAFDRLGTRAATGRLISALDDGPSTAPVAVLSHAYWQRRFGGDATVLGRAFDLEGRHVQIVGVAEPRFGGVEPGRPTDVWLPYSTYNPNAIGNAAFNWFRILGRMKDDTRPEAVQSVLQAAFTNFRRDRTNQTGYTGTAEDRAHFLAAPLFVRSAATGPSPLRQQFGRSLWILAVIAGLVLLVAGTNLANLYLARGAARGREMALRVSLGAGRGRLVQQLLIESALVAALAGLLGLALASASAPAIVAMLASPDDPVQLDLRLNGTVLAVAGGLTLLVTLLFGLAPAWRASRTDPMGALQAGGARTSARASVMRPFVAAQIAFGVTVLFVGALLVRSFTRLSGVDPGFATSGVVLIDVEPTRATNDATRRAALVDVLDQLRTRPGINGVAVAEFNPLGRAWTAYFRSPAHPEDVIEATLAPVSDGYFEAMKIPLRAGRTFARADVDPATSTWVVNETFARRYFGTAPAVGAVVPGNVPGSRDGREGSTVIGVVADARYNLREAPAPTIYVPMRTAGTLLVRVGIDAAANRAVLRDAVRAANPLLRVTTVSSERELIDRTLVRERLLAALSSFFALVGLALVGVGLYGVLSYAVVHRTREIGVRVALGARPAAVIWTVVREVAIPAFAGAAAGTIAGLYLSRYLETLLFEVTPSDPISVALPLAAFGIAAALSAALPAIRATRIAPMAALRHE